jgi:hypothetical protein
MDFYLIMGIGTVVTIWVVANLPKSGGAIHADDWPTPDPKPPQTPAWRKDISETFATDDLDYLRKLERHQDDPEHWPFPLPPP